MVILVVASAALAVFVVLIVVSMGQAALLVDTIPGGDAGLATTPTLEAWRSTLAISFAGAVVSLVVVGAMLPTLLRTSRR